ncbi:hypothetical protein [Oceaniglobus roseus]|uniref:hypothetical protein n=1 Tax=Oceaniglobus roseus TaxID=1737570 RepID=UPI000C7EA4DC|nr:hypothetical protein [Kandeliimicrobium roseum]
MSDPAPKAGAPTPGTPPVPPLPVALLRMGLRLLVILALAWGAHLLLERAMDLVERLPDHRQDVAMTTLLASAVVLYAALIAIPFVPGVEIGISLLLLGGAGIAPFIYLGTVTGLMAAYLAGRFLPYRILHRFFLDLRLTRACRLLEEIEPLSRPRRLALLRARLPGQLGTWAVRFRYLTIAALLNLPGTALIGGGGGICLIAGLSGLFSRLGMFVTVVLSTLPVPLAVWLWGPSLLAR